MRGALEMAGFEDDFVHLWVLAVKDVLSAGVPGAVAALVGLAGDARVGRLPALFKGELLRFLGLLAVGPETAELLRAAAQALTSFGAVFSAAKAQPALADVLEDDTGRTDALDSCERTFAELGAQAFLCEVEQARSRVRQAEPT